MTGKPIDPDAATGTSRWIPFLVASAFFMENLDATVITTAVPAMAQSFAVAPARLSIGISAYMLALAVFIPASGWLADRFGPRAVFSSAIAVFTLASVWCGFSTSLEGFTAARVAQGIGGAMMVPVGRLVVLRTTRKADLIRAIATITWPGLAAPVLGPSLGGFITSTWSWHWIFFLNVPLGVLALVAALRLIGAGTGAPRPFDLSGFVLSGLGCSLVMLGIEAASHRPLDAVAAAAMLAGGIVTMTLGILHMRRTAHPLVDLFALRDPTFSVTVLGGSCFRVAIGSAPFLLPLMFQLAFGYGAVRAGLLMLALFGGNLAIKPATTWLMRAHGFRRVLLVNGVVVAVGFAACALLTRDTPAALIAVVLFATGVSRSIQYGALNSVAFADVPPPHMSGATTIFSVLQQMNAGMGIAFGALALSIAEMLHGTPPGMPTTGDFHIALWIVAALPLIGVVDMLRLDPDAGAEARGARASASKD